MKRLIAGFVLAAAFGSAAAFGGQEVVEEIVAIVNDDIITLSEIREMLELARNELDAAQLPKEQYDQQFLAIKQGLLDRMITELLLLQKAKELEINISEQLKGVLEKLKQDNNIATDADLRKAVEQSGIAYETWLKQYEEGLMRQGVLFTEVERAIVLEDAEIVQYYKKNPAEFTMPTEYELRAVYLSAEMRTAEECEALKAAVDAKVKAGAALPDVAAELSDPPMKDNKGELGSFKAGELDKTLESAVEKLKPGERSAWVSLKNGWYLLELVKRTESRLRGFEDVRKEVEERLFNEKRAAKGEEYLKTLRERSFVKILKPNPLDY